MSIPTDVDLTRTAAKRAKAEIVERLAPELISRNIGSEGQTYGTDRTDRADRILAYIEDREMGVHDRVIDGVSVPGTLRAVNPDLEDEMTREFVRDVNASPMFGRTQEDESIRESAGMSATLEGIV